uniref:Isoprenylcysteine carboxyl methyltransferase n=1 Tax=uncultured bacterium CSLF43 TaxID=1091575 RepID=G4WW12_9BACT|nr:putative protein-S-isoprenylcysteine methyltransferase [uncultured bacterium CSLF43]
MRLIGIAGAVFAVVHLFALAWGGNMTPTLGVLAATGYLSSLGLFWWAVATNRWSPLSAAFSDDAPRWLVRDGPYRLIRHPFYCSYLLAWASGAVATLEWWVIATVIVMLAIYLYAARSEERKFQSSELAETYRSYRESTGLFAPNPRKLLTARRGR